MFTGIGPVRRALQRGVRYGVLPSSVWRRIPVSGPIDVALGFGISFLYVSSEYDAIGRRLFFGGLEAWEGADVLLFANLARRSRTVVDVGAHTGVYALSACAASADVRVVALEPLEAPRMQLRAALLHNGWETRCEVRIEAAWDEAGVAKLFIPEHPFPSEASLVNTATRSEDVETLRLDSLDCGPVDLVKMDVECGEPRVLEGMTRWLEDSPPIVLLEVLDARVGQAIQHALSPYGYRYFRTADGDVLELPRLESDVDGGSRNVFAVPPDKMDWISV